MTTSISVVRKLIERSAALARTSPNSWAEFIEALEAYSNEQRNILVQSPLDVLQVTQGRAQAVSQLLELLRDCVRRADKRENKS